jgi:hypothetical protein
MKKEVMKKWVAALRSGKYRQGEGQLKIPAKHQGHVKYCCLGVLCDIAPKTVGEWGKKKTPYPNFAGSDGSLGKKVRNWSGVKTDTGQVIADGKPCNLAYLNDVEGVSFKKIADVIEDNWRKL